MLPVVTIDGGPSVTTNDSTPTITGTSDVAPGTTMHVSVGTQDRTALVQADQTWNTTPTALTDGTRTVTATVNDPAGNEGTSTQSLTIDTAAPAVTITGGADALTNDATPTISGNVDVAPGTVVTVDLADETLTAQVQAGGGWSVTASALSDGPHRITVSVSDAAGNSGGATQRLTVDTVLPSITVDGGATASTSDPTPTITGTTDVALRHHRLVTPSERRTRTVFVQADQTWNATPTAAHGWHRHRHRHRQRPRRKRGHRHASAERRHHRRRSHDRRRSHHDHDRLDPDD